MGDAVGVGVSELGDAEATGVGSSVFVRGNRGANHKMMSNAPRAISRVAIVRELMRAVLA